MAKAKKGKLAIEDALVPVEEQPYEIPKNWCWTRVKYISDVVTGSTPSKKNEEYYGGDFPFFKPADLDAGDNVVEASEYLSKEGKEVSRVIPELSTAVCCIGSIGKSGLLRVEGTTNQQINSMIPKINPLYLYYYSKTNEFVTELWDKSTATTISLVNKNNMETNTIPLAPLAEQKRIVEQIENFFLKLDEAKDNSCEVVDKTRLRKSAILQAALDGSLTKKWRSDNGIKMGSWKTKKIGYIVKPVKDKYDPTKDEMLDIPYIGLEHMEKSGGLIGSGSSEEVKSTKTLFNKGDILYGKLRPYLDKHDVVDFDGMCSTDILVYRAENESTARYINYLLGTIDFMDYAVENSSGINLPRTSEKIVSAYEVEFPTVEEQDAICNILDSMLQREDAIIDVAEDFIERVELMKKSILVKAFRGELGTNNPEEESSIALLKEMLEKN